MKAECLIKRFRMVIERQNVQPDVLLLDSQFNERSTRGCVNRPISGFIPNLHQPSACRGKDFLDGNPYEQQIFVFHATPPLFHLRWSKLLMLASITGMKN